LAKVEKKSSFNISFFLPVFNEPEKSEDIKEKAYREGFELGLKEGREKAENESKEILQRLESLIKSLQRIREEIYKKAEEEILELSVAIAKKILRRELELNRSSILQLVREAIRRLTEEDTIKIYLSFEDFELVKRHREELLRELGESKNLIISPSQEVSPGGCFVETEFAQVDARLETQLETIVQGLKNGY
jgi:flagellar assembly protein FliH